MQRVAEMGSTYMNDFNSVEEQRILLVELDQVRADWAVGARVMENILGLTAGFLDEGAALPLREDAEAQLRRLLEVARLANGLLGENFRSWLIAAEERLGFATPIEMMQRPGGLTLVRELLRDAWDEIEPFGRHGAYR